MTFLSRLSRHVTESQVSFAETTHKTICRVRLDTPDESCRSHRVETTVELGGGGFWFTAVNGEGSPFWDIPMKQQWHEANSQKNKKRHGESKQLSLVYACWKGRISSQICSVFIYLSMGNSSSKMMKSWHWQRRKMMTCSWYSKSMRPWSSIPSPFSFECIWHDIQMELEAMTLVYIRLPKLHV